jgi:murein DD-endopeptidase MepM/ murein hydrolase activator NlpD
MPKITNPSKLLPSAKSTPVTRISKNNLSTFVKPIKKTSTIAKINKDSSIAKSTLNQEIEEINAKLLKIKSFLGKDLLSSKKKAETKRKQKEKQDFEEAEKKLETPKSKKLKLPSASLPSIGIFDRIKRFLFFTALGWLVPRLIEFLPKLQGIAKIIGGVYKFAEGLFGKLFDGFMSLVKFGGDLKKKTLGFIAELKVGSGGNYESEFKRLENQFNTFANASIIAGLLSVDIGLAAVDEYNKWKKKSESVKGVTGGKLAGKFGLRDVGRELGERKPGYQDPSRYRAKGQSRAGGFALEQARKKATKQASKPGKAPSWWDKMFKGPFAKLKGPLSKFAGAVVPGVGAVVGAADAKARFATGDTFGGTLAAASATLDAWTAATAILAFTGIGAAAPAAFATISMGIDVFLLIRDILKAFNVPIFNKGGRVVKKYQGGGTTGRPAGVPKKRSITPVRRKPIKIQPPKTQPGKDVGGKNKIIEFYRKEKTDPYTAGPGGWFSGFNAYTGKFDKEEKEKQGPYNALTKTAEIFKDIPFGLGHLMGGAIDATLGQRMDVGKAVKSFSSGVAYLAESIANQKVNLSVSSLMREMQAFASGGTVAPSRELAQSYSSLSSGDMIAKVLGPTIEERVNEAINSIEKEMKKIQEKKGGEPGAGPDGLGGGEGGGGGDLETAGGAVSASELYKEIGANFEQWDIFRNSVALIESGGRYSAMGGSGKRYDGRYQMGEAAKKDGSKVAGVSYPGHSSDPNAHVRVSFRNNPQLQETIFTGFTLANHRYLMRNPKYKSASVERKLQILGYAHNQGMGGAERWLNTGVVGADGFGTKGTKYTDLIAKNFRAKKSGGAMELAQGAVTPSSQSKVLTSGGIVPSQGRITSTYGSQESFRKGPHTGIDYGYDIGTPISLVKSGEVVEASKGYNGGYGNFILVRHDDGTYSMFNHLNDIYVTKGQKINASSGNAPVIGTIGNTGFSTGPHLDFKVATKWDGFSPSGFVDPRRYQDNVFRIGGNVQIKPSQIAKLAMKDDKEGIMENGVWKPKTWTTEERERYQKTSSLQTSKSSVKVPEVKDLSKQFTFGMQGGGIINPQKSRLPVPNSFASYESPGGGMMIAIQPMIIEKPVPVASSKNSVIDFVPISVNNNRNSSLSVG